MRCYRAEPEVRKAMFKKYYSMHRRARLGYFRKYHCRIIEFAPANPTKYFRCVQANLLADSEMKTKLVKQFKSQHFDVTRKLSRKKLIWEVQWVN